MVPKIFEIFAKKFAGPGNPLENKGKPLQKNLTKKKWRGNPPAPPPGEKYF
jgi:hypothetical protein